MKCDEEMPRQGRRWMSAAEHACIPLSRGCVAGTSNVRERRRQTFSAKRERGWAGTARGSTSVDNPALIRGSILESELRNCKNSLPTPEKRHGIQPMPLCGENPADYRPSRCFPAQLRQQERQLRHRRPAAVEQIRQSRLQFVRSTYPTRAARGLGACRLRRERIRARWIRPCQFPAKMKGLPVESSEASSEIHYRTFPPHKLPDNRKHVANFFG